MNLRELNKEIGQIDLFLLDFLLKYPPHAADKILDLGCGEGRNLFYLIKNGYDVWGVDRNHEAIRFCRLLARQFNLTDLDARFQKSDIGSLRFPAQTFNYSFAINVFHFAETRKQLETFVMEANRVLKVGGHMCLRMKIGNENNSDHYYEVGGSQLLCKLIESYSFELLESKSFLDLGQTSFVAFLRKK